MTPVPEGAHHRPRPERGVSEAIEDYAKALYALQARTADDAVKTNAVADRLGVTPASASAMLTRLSELGLALHRPYHGTRLTPAGERVALSVLRRHRLLELFLSEMLDVPWDQIHDEAEVLEHHLSPRLEALISARLDDPKIDPHGDPIPSAELRVAEQRTISLDELEPGAVAIFVRISDADPAMLRYLAERGIIPGVRLRVIERQPFGGPVLVHVAKQRHALGGTLSRAMRVTAAVVKPSPKTASQPPRAREQPARAQPPQATPARSSRPR
jgi:DtxR family transcriptional regulator, Mn-dependent transcriptional regulator